MNEQEDQFDNLMDSKARINDTLENKYNKLTIEEEKGYEIGIKRYNHNNLEEVDGRLNKKLFRDYLANVNTRKASFSI